MGRWCGQSWKTGRQGSIIHVDGSHSNGGPLRGAGVHGHNSENSLCAKIHSSIRNEGSNLQKESGSYKRKWCGGRHEGEEKGANTALFSAMFLKP